MKYPKNLNAIKFKTDYGNYKGSFIENIKLSNVELDEFELYIKDIKKELINKINIHDGPIVGNIAWLTDYDILEALSKKTVQIIIQKEDFLRPDSINDNKFIKSIKKLYNKFSGFDNMNLFDYHISVCGHVEIPGVTCLGNLNSEKNPAHPRAHNKFLVFCDYSEPDENNNSHIVPKSVWTGSFNFTNNSGNSLENSIYFSGRNDIIKKYYEYYLHMLMCSEPLDFSWEWDSTTLRIGT